MAKRIDPYPATATPDNFDQIVGTIVINGVSVARQYVAPPEQSPEYIAEQNALYTAAKASWSVLHTWKKVRWSLCAIATYGNASTVTGDSGYSGYSLYIKSWLEQKPLTGKQPISPCSARVTDPLASPWNYQP